MRRRRLKKLIKRLYELRQQKLTRDQLLIKLGAARKEAGPAAWRIIDIQLPDKDQPVTPETFCFKLNWQKLREARRREGSYLLRSNVTGGDPAQLWAFYLQLVEVEQAFKELKGDLAICPIYHQTDERIEAHIFVAFLAYCLQVTLKQRLRSLAPGLTPRSVLDKMAAIQMVDVQLPTADGRTVILSRYTEPEVDQGILLPSPDTFRSKRETKPRYRARTSRGRSKTLQGGDAMPLGTTVRVRWKRTRANYHYRRLLTVLPEAGPNTTPMFDQAGGQGSGIPVGGVKDEPVTSTAIWPAINYPLGYLL